MMNEERLKEIEAFWVGSHECYDDLREVFAALREAWRMIRTLDIPLEMIADMPVPNNPSTVGEMLRRASKGKRDGQDATE